MKWRWQVTKQSKACIEFGDGTCFEALAWDEGEGEWAGLGKPVKPYGEGGKWKSMKQLPKPLRMKANG